MNKVAVSLLNVDNKDRSKLTNKLIDAGLDWVHYDIMDGIFVPNKAITLEQVKENIDKSKNHFVDIHLMVASAPNYIEKFKDIADLCTFHYESESYGRVESILRNYYGTKIKIGLAINPDTNIEQIYGLLNYLDLVLIMSVQPGKGGQEFREDALTKVTKLRKYIDERNMDILIEVDGGINNETGVKCIQAGSNVLVSGSYLCNNPTKEIISTLKKD